jgi:hypothetical protein
MIVLQPGQLAHLAQRQHSNSSNLLLGFLNHSRDAEEQVIREFLLKQTPFKQLGRGRL